MPGRNQSSLLLAEPPLPIDAEHATDKRAGAPVGVGIGGVLVVVDDFDCHAGTVAWARASRQGGGVRRVGGLSTGSGGRFANRPYGLGWRSGYRECGCWLGCLARHPIPLRFPSGRTGAHCLSGFLPSQEWRLDGAGTMMRRAGPFDWCLLGVETAGGTALRATCVPSRSVLL